MKTIPLHKFNSVVETIGNTPIIKLRSVGELQGTYYAKVEAFNPGGSSKDRIGLSIIEEAEQQGLIQPGGTIVEATSGNTGLGLALVAIDRGYKIILVMPDKMSPEKMNLVKAVGATVVICPTEVKPDDPRSYYSVAKRIAEETPNSFYANQYFNEANPLAHYKTTGPEVWHQTEGKVTHFIAGMGTGGTISGTAKFLKEKNPEIRIIGVDPEGSILAYYHQHRTTDGAIAEGYKVEGVGEDIIPSNVHFDLIDDVVTISDQVSFEWSRRLAREDGLLMGGSSGLAVAGAVKYAQKHIVDPNAVVVILLPDTGGRYLGKVFSDSWLRSNGFLPPARSIGEILGSKPANLPALISIPATSTLLDALDKFRKFSVDVLVVEGEDRQGKLFLPKELVQDQLLAGSSPNITLETLSLEEVMYLDMNSSLDTLRQSVLHHGQVVITEDGQAVGVVTKQNIIDNTNFTGAPN